MEDVSVPGLRKRFYTTCSRNPHWEQEPATQEALKRERKESLSPIVKEYYWCPQKCLNTRLQNPQHLRAQSLGVAEKASSQSSWDGYVRNAPKYPHFTCIRDSRHEVILSFFEIIGLLMPSVATFSTHDTKQIYSYLGQMTYFVFPRPPREKCDFEKA